MFSLEVKNLVKQFGKLKAVDDISFSVPDDQIFGLIGRNGAGKTTTIRMMMNIFAPDSGEVLFRGNKVGEDFRSKVGYLPEERGLYKKMKVLDTILFFGDVKGKSPASIKPKAEEYLRQFDLYERRNSKIEELSKGNQQKVQFICTIIHDPDFIILDEPFSGMDPVNTELLKDIILELKNKGKVIILSTHLMEFAEKICGSIALIDQGKIILSGTVNELKSKFAGDVASLQMEGDTTFLEHLPYVESIDKAGTSYSIKLKHQEYSSALLQALMEKHIKVNRFVMNEISLHQIFVQVAGNENTAKKEVLL